MVGWNHDNAKWKTKVCLTCGSTFVPNSGAQKFCSSNCGFASAKRKVSTEYQYEKISGNWERYLARLLYSGGVKRSKLSVEDLLSLLEEQEYKCALSGINLQCHLEVGRKNIFNASIDRVEAGGPYVVKNIRLVCNGINKWRSDTPTKEFIEICRSVVEYNDSKKGVQDGC